MPFSRALDLLKNGYKLARTGWNGANMYVKLIPSVDTEYTKGLEHEPFFIIKTPRDTISMWVPSVSDLLANDWIVIE